MNYHLNQRKPGASSSSSPKEGGIWKVPGFPQATKPRLLCSHGANASETSEMARPLVTTCASRAGICHRIRRATPKRPSGLAKSEGRLCSGAKAVTRHVRLEDYPQRSGHLGPLPGRPIRRLTCHLLNNHSRMESKGGVSLKRPGG